jgi:hypothetical protein
MDVDVFPNSLEYWGPNGMVFFRNIQFRFMPIKGDSRITVALERPGASADQGRFEDRIELDDIFARFPLPDLSAEGRLARKWGYVELAGVLRYMKWDDVLDTDTFDLSGDAMGWGVSLSSNLKLGKRAVFKFQAVGGEGAENYMNDAPVDVGIVLTPLNLRRPIEGEASLLRFDRIRRLPVEPAVQQLARVFAARYRQHGWQLDIALRSVRAGQRPLLPDYEHHGGRRIPMGPPQQCI